MKALKSGRLLIWLIMTMGYMPWSSMHHSLEVLLYSYIHCDLCSWFFTEKTSVFPSGLTFPEIVSRDCWKSWIKKALYCVGGYWLVIDVDVYRIRLSVKKNQPTELSIRPCGGGDKTQDFKKWKKYLYLLHSWFKFM